MRIIASLDVTVILPTHWGTGESHLPLTQFKVFVPLILNPVLHVMDMVPPCNRLPLCLPFAILPVQGHLTASRLRKNKMTTWQILISHWRELQNGAYPDLTVEISFRIRSQKIFIISHPASILTLIPNPAKPIVYFETAPFISVQYLFHSVFLRILHYMRTYSRLAELDMCHELHKAYCCMLCLL